MKTLRNKIVALAISIFFILSMTAAVTLIPNASAHNPPYNIPTYAYIFASPNPIGVGQTTHVYMWLDMVYGSGGTNVNGGAFPAGQYSTAELSNNYRFHDYQFTVTAPDGTNTTTTFPIVADSTSDQAASFTPATTGTYTLTFHYPGQVYGANGDGNPLSNLVNDTYLPSTASMTVTVQSAPIPVEQGTPLPTSYWTYPIYGQNYAWISVSSNWLGGGNTIPLGPSGYTSTYTYQADGVGPLTSHIMWTTPEQFGGEVGGNLFTNDQSVGYFEGSSYAPRFLDPIIIDGYLYYTVVASFTGSPIMGGSATGPTVCVNLKTGQQLWSKQNVPQLTFGYTYDVYDPDQHGVFPPILVAKVTYPVSQWELFDGFTGDSLFNVTGIPSGNMQWGPSGEYLQYVWSNLGTSSNPNWYLAEWNSSRLWVYDTYPYTGSGSLSPSITIQPGYGLVVQVPIPITGESVSYPNGTSVIIPYGTPLTENGNVGIAQGASLGPYHTLTDYDWNYSVAWRNSVPTTPALSVGAVDYGDMELLYSTLPAGYEASGFGNGLYSWTMYAVNLNASKGVIGSLMWSKSYTAPPGNLSISFHGCDWQTRTFVLEYGETMQWVGYSLTNGAQLWGPTTSENALSYYGTPGSPPSAGWLAYGNLYTCSYGGIVYCWNDVTGQLVFTWGNGPMGSDNSTNSGFNGPYGVYPIQVQSISNGVVYIATDEHTVTDPIYYGAMLWAINATTGKLVWGLSGYPSEWSGEGNEWAVAAGNLVFFNGYDTEITSIGRGPSQTTVTAPNSGLTNGQPAVISGRVIDISAGTQQSEQASDFPNGVPCSSDATMTQWMEYVYDQQPEPTNFTGVPVTITVTDSNHNTQTIGTAITNEEGVYTLTWVPDITGNYTVAANFAGNNGYYPSSDMTFFAVYSPTVSTAPTATPLTGLASTATVEYGIVAVIIVIIIGIAVLAMLMLRKRP